MDISGWPGWSWGCQLRIFQQSSRPLRSRRPTTPSYPTSYVPERSAVSQSDLVESCGRLYHRQVMPLLRIAWVTSSSRWVTPSKSMPRLTWSVGYDWAKWREGQESRLVGTNSLETVGWETLIYKNRWNPAIWCAKNRGCSDKCDAWLVRTQDLAAGWVWWLEENRKEDEETMPGINITWRW